LNKVIIDGNTLTLEDIVQVCRHYKEVELSEEAKENIIKSRKVVDEFVEKEQVVYGITTGFGKFSDVTISKEDSKLLQKNLIVSHAVGAGDPFPTDVVRGIMLLRINSLAKGYSGVEIRDHRDHDRNAQQKGPSCYTRKGIFRC